MFGIELSSLNEMNGCQSLALCALLMMSAITVSGRDFPAVDKLPSRPELPDALTMLDGTPVKTSEQWVKDRRPELKELFQHYMYGYMPPPPGINARITQTDDSVFDGKATLKEVEISFKNLTAPNAPKIHLALFIPNHRQAPAPVFLALNKCGNFTVTEHHTVTIDPDTWCHEACEKKEYLKRGSKRDFWCVDYLIERGYAFATYHESNIDPDENDFTNGIHPFYSGLPGDKDSQWGTISAWAWGLQRCVDYLVTDNDIDKDWICVTGHSRRGKTALLAAALDERFALAVPHQSGTGGCALSRNNNQETLERINRVFPHWFNGNFKKFNDREEFLPFDQHLLMALVAPRALMDTAGIQDTWANYESSLLALKEADKVYKFLGAPGLVGEGLLVGDVKIDATNSGNLLQYRRDTKHLLNAGYWEAILDFSERCRKAAK